MKRNCVDSSQIKSESFMKVLRREMFSSIFNHKITNTVIDHLLFARNFFTSKKACFTTKKLHFPSSLFPVNFRRAFSSSLSRYNKASCFVPSFIRAWVSTRHYFRWCKRLKRQEREKRALLGTYARTVRQGQTDPLFQHHHSIQAKKECENTVLRQAQVLCWSWDCLPHKPRIASLSVIVIALVNEYSLTMLLDVAKISKS